MVSHRDRDPAVEQAAAVAGVSLVSVGRPDIPPEASVVDAGPGALFYDCLAQVALSAGQHFHGVLMIHDGALPSFMLLADDALLCFHLIMISKPE